MTETPSSPNTGRTLSVLMHISSLAIFLSAIGIPILNILAPLILWLVKRDEYPEITPHAKAVLNFQITLTLFVGIPLMILTFTIILAVITVPLGIIALLLSVWFTIQGAIKANEGVVYQYPFSYQFIK
jgi:uncharacterized protein